MVSGMDAIVAFDVSKSSCECEMDMEQGPTNPA